MGSGRGLPHLSGDTYASEDDRPEEVSLEAAKSDLQKKNSEEQAAKRRQSTQAKEARRRQSQKKAEDGSSDLQIATKSSRKEKTRKRKSGPTDEDASQLEANETQPSGVPGIESEELLPAGVLEELAKKERLDIIKRVAANQEKPAKPRPRTKRKQGVSSASGKE